MLNSGKTEGKGERTAEKEGKRRARNGKGAVESSQKGGSLIFSSFACGNY